MINIFMEHNGIFLKKSGKRGINIHEILVD